MTKVYTAHGIGEIVQTERERGITSHLVKGAGFSIWLDATQIRTADGSDAAGPQMAGPGAADPAAGGGGLFAMPFTPDKFLDPRAMMYGGGNPEKDFITGSDAFNHDPAWHVNESNSTTLPYDPTPQNDATVVPGPDGSWGPGEYEFDPKQRLTPSDSRTQNDKRPSHPYPGPSPKLFATGAHSAVDYGLIDASGSAYPARYEVAGGDDWGYRQAYSEGEKGYAPLPEGPRAQGPDHREYPRQRKDPAADRPRLQEGDEPVYPFDKVSPSGNVTHEMGEGDEPDWYSCPDCGAWHNPFRHMKNRRGPKPPGSDNMFQPAYKGASTAPLMVCADCREAGGRHQAPFLSDPKDLVQHYPVTDASEWLRQNPHEDDPSYVEPPAGPRHRAASRDEFYLEPPTDMPAKYADIAPAPQDSYFLNNPEMFINRYAAIMEGETGLDPRVGMEMDLVLADKQYRDAAWRDVRAKGKRLRDEGRVHLKEGSPEAFYATVDGDNGSYDTIIVRGNVFDLGGQSVTSWHCDCDWGKWAFKRKLTYVGRFCSHAYASYLEMQSQFNKPGERGTRVREGAFDPAHATPEQIADYEAYLDRHDLRGNAPDPLDPAPSRQVHFDPTRTSSVVDDFKSWAKENEQPTDEDSLQNFITLPKDEDEDDDPPLTRDEVSQLYDYVRGNRAETPERQYDIPYTFDHDKVYKDAGGSIPGLPTPPSPAQPGGSSMTPEQFGLGGTNSPGDDAALGPWGGSHGVASVRQGDALRTTPRSLTPSLQFVPEGEDEHLVDVTKDERKTTAPDNMIHKGGTHRSLDEQLDENPERQRPTEGEESDQIEHFSAVLPPFLAADEQRVNNPTPGSPTNPRPDAGESTRDLNKLRNLIDQPLEDSFGHMEDRNDHMRDLVDDLHDAGVDASPIAASRHIADSGGLDHYLDFAHGHWGGEVSHNSLKDYVDKYRPHPHNIEPMLDYVDDHIHRESARQFEADGGFMDRGDGGWADLPFAGSGPDPKNWYGTSEDYVDENERPRFQDVTTVPDYDILKYNDTDGPVRAPKEANADPMNTGTEDPAAGGGGGVMTMPGLSKTVGIGQPDPIMPTALFNRRGDAFSNNTDPGTVDTANSAPLDSAEMGGGQPEVAPEDTMGTTAALQFYADDGASQNNAAGGGDDDDDAEFGMGQSSTPVTPPGGGGGSYTVKPGDTLSGIAQGHGMGDNYQGLVDANPGQMGSGTDLGMDPNMIHPGDQLHMPGAGADMAAPSAGSGGMSGGAGRGDFVSKEPKTTFANRRQRISTDGMPSIRDSIERRQMQGYDQSTLPPGWGTVPPKDDDEDPLPKFPGEDEFDNVLPQVPIPGGGKGMPKMPMPVASRQDAFSEDDSDIVRQFHATQGAQNFARGGGGGGGGGSARAAAMAGHSGGGRGRFSESDIAGAADAFLQRTAGRTYSPSEQAELMDEYDPRGARNLGGLDLRGTHYMAGQQ